jgi:uncharacterized protein
MAASEPDTSIIVFARAPRPGEAKTRLIPLLGAEGAAALHAALVERALETACASGLSSVELHAAPDGEDAFIRDCAARFGATVHPQVGADLGARMFNAFAAALSSSRRVLLIGSDCPALTPSHLRDADRALRDGADAVFAPCEDGGYALVGLRRAARDLFTGIAWGGESVMAASRSRLESMGWRWHELETLWDVDRPEDYDRLVRSGLLDAGQRARPGTNG